MARRTSDAATQARRAVADIPEQLAALRKMTVAELREKYREVYGEPSRSRNKDWLRKKVAWRIQELAEGGLSDRARARIEELADGAPMRRRSSGNGAGANAPTAASEDQAAPRDPRLPEPGTVLTRTHDGVEHRVTVLDDGFEYRGERHASLSKIAREISGTNWNGFLYFGLQRRTRKQNGEGA
ncbi:MAG: DUF2924 domain-containing protein [Myxococcales bacterium]|nr:DUF2924 domain-containing protein [Myxococcales bacterium]